MIVIPAFQMQCRVKRLHIRFGEFIIVLSRRPTGCECHDTARINRMGVTHIVEPFHGQSRINRVCATPFINQVINDQRRMAAVTMYHPVQLCCRHLAHERVVSGRMESSRFLQIQQSYRVSGIQCFHRTNVAVEIDHIHTETSGCRNLSFSQFP